MVNREVLDAIRARLREMADPVRAAGARGYIKSAMPFLGVRVPDVRRLTTAAAARYPFGSAGEQRATVPGFGCRGCTRGQDEPAVTPGGVEAPA